MHMYTHTHQLNVSFKERMGEGADRQDPHEPIYRHLNVGAPASMPVKSTFLIFLDYPVLGIFSQYHSLPSLASNAFFHVLTRHPVQTGQKHSSHSENYYRIKMSWTHGHLKRKLESFLKLISLIQQHKHIHGTAFEFYVNSEVSACRHWAEALSRPPALLDPFTSVKI